MAKEQTENSRYRSPSTGDFCTAAQYLAELICQRQATRDKIGTLPYKFWNNSKWKKVYIRQVALANKLIKSYGDDFVRFIKSKSGSRIISLGARNLESQYKNFLERSPVKEAGTTVQDIYNKSYKPRKTFGGNTLFAKIRNIENGES
jgi:hypothetical protein